jgi:hypothetical protein
VEFTKLFQSFILIKHTWANVLNCFSMVQFFLLNIHTVYILYRLERLLLPVNSPSKFSPPLSVIIFTVLLIIINCASTVQNLLQRYKVNSVTVLYMCFVFTLSS